MVQRLNKSPEVSRRGLLGAAALPELCPAGLATLSLADACRAWLDANGEERRLLIKWGDVEAGLAREIGWYELTDAERAAHPRKRDLDAIDEAIAQAGKEGDRLLSLIATLSDTTNRAIHARLLIVSKLIEPRDFPEAHALLRSVMRDLTLQA